MDGANFPQDVDGIFDQRFLKYSTLKTRSALHKADRYEPYQSEPRGRYAMTSLFGESEPYQCRKTDWQTVGKEL